MQGVGVGVQVYMYFYACCPISVHARVYVCMHVCMCVCMYVYKYVCMYHCVWCVYLGAFKLKASMAMLCMRQSAM